MLKLCRCLGEKKLLPSTAVLGEEVTMERLTVRRLILNSLSPLNFTLICIYVTAELNQLAQKVPVVVKQCVCVPVLLL